MKQLNKKGAFEAINAGMISFIGFVLISLLVILLISTTKSITIVCPSSQTTVNGTCLGCDSGFTYNGTGNVCCNATSTNCEDGGANDNQSAFNEYTGSAYNATKDLQGAAALPPQFSQIIVITLIIVGIIVMLGALGLATYRKMKD